MEYFLCDWYLQLERAAELQKNSELVSLSQVQIESLKKELSAMKQKVEETGDSEKELKVSLTDSDLSDLTIRIYSFCSFVSIAVCIRVYRE